MRSVSVPPPLAGRGGAKLVVPERPALARDRVLHVAARPSRWWWPKRPGRRRMPRTLVEVDYEALPAVTETARAVDPAAPQLQPGGARQPRHRLARPRSG